MESGNWKQTFLPRSHMFQNSNSAVLLLGISMFENAYFSNVVLL